MAKKKLTPTEIAEHIVPRFLDGETLSRRQVQRDYKAKRGEAQVSIRYARDILRDQHNVMLPLAHHGNGYSLTITTDWRVALLAEESHAKGVATRLLSTIDRLEIISAHGPVFFQKANLMFQAQGLAQVAAQEAFVALIDSEAGK